VGGNHKGFAVRLHGVLSEAFMAETKNVTGTAFVVAEFRAEENWESTPLYHDPVVGLFLNQDTREAAARVAASFPHVKDLVRLRTKYLDDMLEKQIRSHVRQVVVLGAGLDTRAVRKRAAGVSYFEIDDAATLELKRDCYRKQGIEADVTFIPGNYVKEGVIELLQPAGFDPRRSTYIIWEGNTMYLTLDANRHVLTELRRYVRRFRLSFDYMAEAVVSRTTGDPGITRLVESFAAMGAPWLSGIRDARALAAELHLTPIENFRTADLFRTYWPSRPMTSPVFLYYSVCTVDS
jgi:methyltransferase (TIGR00027 family)